MKYLPAIIFGLMALGCVALARSGDNTDARALAGIFYVPAVVLALMTAGAAFIAWVD